MKKMIAALMAMVMVLMLLPATALAEETDGRNLWRVKGIVTYGQTEARSMLELINQFRTNQQEEKAGYWKEDNSEMIYLDQLGALQYDYQLEQEAMCRAAELSIEFGHTCPSGDSCWVAAPHSSGENIACGYTNAADVFKAWREDAERYEGQGHRRNMLGEGFTSVGIGHAIVGGVHYWVQEFGTDVYNSTGTPALDDTVAVELVVDLNRHPEIANGPALPEEEQSPAEPSAPAAPSASEEVEDSAEQVISESDELDTAAEPEQEADGADQPGETVKKEEKELELDQQGNVLLVATADSQKGAVVSAEELEKVTRFMEKNTHARKAVLQMGQMKVLFDRQAIRELVSQVETDTRISFAVEEIDAAKSNMNQAQKQTMQRYMGGKVLHFSMQQCRKDGSLGPALHIDQGHICLAVAYELPQNQCAQVAYIEKDGALMEVKSTYDSTNKELVWKVESGEHAYYLLHGAMEESKEAEHGSDERLLPVIAVICAAGVAVGAVYVVWSRRKNTDA